MELSIRNARILALTGALLLTAMYACAQDDIHPYDYLYGKPHPLLVPSKEQTPEICPIDEDFDDVEIPDTAKTRRRLPLSVKTNLVYDAALALNGGLELGIGNDWSVGTDGWIAWMRNKRHNEWYQHYGFDLYGRWWFGKSHTSRLTGWHVGFYGGTFTYDLYPEGSGYQCPDMFKTFRTGVEIGWARSLGKRWKIDFYGGLGFLHTKQKVYKRNVSHNGYYLKKTQCRNLPDFTRFGISISYTF